MATQGRLRFNVGGKIFETTTTTFSEANANSSLRAMVGDDQSVEHSIDADPACFGVLLNLLRTDELHLPPNISVALLYREAHRYKLLDKLRSAQHAKLDGDNLKLTTSKQGPTLANKPALIRASAKGDCAVANGNGFHFYDGMFQELSTMNLDCSEIVGMEWCDPENILISSQKDSSSRGGGDGGKIGLFHPQTGELKHLFSLIDDKCSTSSKMIPGNVAIGSDKQIFCCCKDGSRRKQDTIRVWDITTSCRPTISLEVQSVGNAFKLQWLPDNKNLMAVINNSDGSKIILLDLRAATPVVCSYPMKSQRRVVDAVGIEEKNCVCVIDENGRFGFVDIRKKVDNIKKGGKQPRSFNEHDHEKWFPLDGDEGVVKLKLHGKPNLGWHRGKLFRSVDDIVSVYCEFGSKWRLVSHVRPKHEGGLIHDFSIGGDRLFALQVHSNQLCINIWETPRPPSVLI